MKNQKDEIDELVKKLYEMIQNKKTKSEIDKTAKKLNKLLEKYLNE